MKEIFGKKSHLPPIFWICCWWMSLRGKGLPSRLCLFRPSSWASVMNILESHLHVKPSVTITMINPKSPHIKCALIYCWKELKALPTTSSTALYVMSIVRKLRLLLQGPHFPICFLFPYRSALKASDSAALWLFLPGNLLQCIWYPPLLTHLHYPLFLGLGFVFILLNSLLSFL